MGVRKRLKAEERKTQKKGTCIASLKNCPTSPRKMRLIADLIRGKNVEQALSILKFSPQEASNRVEKLLVSAIANWKNKNESVRLEESNLYVKEIFVDGGRTLRRMLPAPQGRAYRIRKRSNHVTIILDNFKEQQQVETTELETQNKE